MRPLKKYQSCSTMAVKCYEEQLKNGEIGLITAIKAMSAKEIEIVAIKHDRSIEKTHWHILMRGGYREKRFIPVSTLKKISVVFRDGIDDELWNNHGVETTEKFENYVTYLLHQTDAAKNDGKEPYEKTDFITNLSDAYIDEILTGYAPRSKKNDVKIMYNDLAREAGYNLQNYNDFIDGLGITNMSATAEKSIRSCYLLGAEKRAKEHQKVCRLLVHIYAKNNEDAEACAYASEKALADKKIFVNSSVEPLLIEPDTEAVVMKLIGNEEDKLKLLDSLSTENIVMLGKVSEKQIWSGDTLVVVTKTEKIPKLERYFQCNIEDDKLYCKRSPEVRFLNAEKEKIVSAYKSFKEEFDKCYAEYIELYAGNSIDLDELNS